MNLRYLSMSQLSEVTGLDRRTVKDRLAKQKPYKTEGKAILYEARKAIPILLGFGDPDAKDIGRQQREQELRHEKIRAEKLEIEVGRMKKELVPIEDVCKSVEQEYTYTRTSLLSIPVKCAKALSLETDPAVVQATLAEYINEALAHLQADKTLASGEVPKEKPENSDNHEE